MLKQFLKSPHRAFIFDCDGTIGDTMGLYFQAWNRALKDVGAPAQLEWGAFCNNGGRDFAASVREYNDVNGCNIDPRVLEELMEGYYGTFLPHVRPIKQVMELILAEKKRPMAVASSGLRVNVAYILKHLQLEKRMQAVVTREDVIIDGVAYVKPKPHLFLEAAKRLNISPKECMVFDDSPLGIEAAHAAGMECFQISHELWDLRFRDRDIPFEDRS
ncbi:MAG: HAD family phosphatase [Puniceicoccales bacterium]|jgi:HAD superfamily hydrolase (TIGR01509 family)|nr:HAD family phosphatase [Puniceicoccales bacterium]